MKQRKLHLDTRPQQQPEGSYPYGKNGIQNDLDDSVFNEPGFQQLAGVVLPYKLNGVIETDSYPIVFSTDNTNSAIGILDTDNEVYIPVVNDKPGVDLLNWPNDGSLLGFTLDNYITGRSQRNYKAELVCAFTDKVTYPKYLNLDDPQIESADDIRLHPVFSDPKITVEENLGGRLEPGAYYVAIALEKSDGTVVPYSAISSVTIVTPSAVESTTDKSLLITVTNIDQDYEFLKIAVISKVEGVLSAVELTESIPIGGTSLTYTFTGDNLTTDIDVTEILTKPIIYSKVGTFGILNDALYEGNLEIEPDILDMQPYALAVGIEWTSELISAINPPRDHVNGIQKSLMHQEVYAFFIRYHKTRGGYTPWYVTAGNSLMSADTADSSEATAGGSTTAIPKYKVEDTIPYFDPVNKTGGTGKWKNDTELYPDTADFDATSLGGRNLRNQPVLHHRMPSVRWCKANLYKTEDEYGRTKLDLLGIKAINVRIPDKYQGILDGYEIGYAKRTIGNMTVYGQSVLLHGARNGYAANPIYTSGGNWGTSIWHKGDKSFDNRYELSQLRKDTFRFHGFDILFNKPSIEPTFISAQLKLRRNILTRDSAYGYIEDGSDSGAVPTTHLVDYTFGNVPSEIGTGKQLRKVSESSYLTGNINANDFVNTNHEDTFAGKLLGTDWSLSYGNAGLRVKGQSYTETAIGSPKFEETYLINLLAVKTDIYSNFYSQSPVSAGVYKELTDTTEFWGGDTFVCDYTFHTYGRHETNDGWGDGAKGKKVIRRFICESVSNIHLRYEISGNVYSKWYPRTALQEQNTYINTFERSKDPNQFGYSKDFNALNDLLDTAIFSPFREYLTSFPYRIHRGGKNSRQTKPRSWRTFLPLDYYEMPKDKGVIVNLDGQDDHLLIHMENALFSTQDKAKLDGGVLSITLGAGDIFQYEPQEGISSKLGYAGTQHDLACYRCPIGYLFVDAKLGEMYLWKGQLQNLNEGVNTFFREYLKVTDKNIFAGNGITIGWDQKYKRILLTVKNVRPPEGQTIKTFEDTTDFWNDLQVGDLVNYNNRIVVYQGDNDTEYDCPSTPVLPTYTWEATDPYCLTTGSPAWKNTGYKAYATRRRLTDGVPDGTTEDNLINSGSGPYFSPVIDTTSCPIPPDETTWQGSDAYCEQFEQPCNEGWVLSPDGTTCTLTEETAPTILHNDWCLAASSNVVYGEYFSRIYNPGFAQSSIGLFTAPGADVFAEMTTATLWRNATGTTTDGPCNRYGVWLDSNCDGTKDPLSAGQQATMYFSYNNTGAQRTVYVGVFSDNQFTLKVNDETIATATSVNVMHFKTFHLFPVTLKAGMNLFNLVGIGDGTVNDAFGMAVFDNTPEQLRDAAVEGDLTLLFHSDSLIGQTMDVATCPDGYALNDVGGNLVCQRLTTEAANQEGNTGYIAYRQRCRYINGIADGYCEENTNDSPATGIGPHIPPVENTDLCPVGPAPDPGTVTIEADVEFSCSNEDCTEDGQVSLAFTFTEETPVALEILIGEVVNEMGVIKYQGSQIFTPPVGSEPNTYYDDGNGTVPFIVSIPQGVTEFTFNAPIVQQLTSPEIGVYLAWRCNNCALPVTDLHFKLSEPESGYALNFTMVNNSITAHNE